MWASPAIASGPFRTQDSIVAVSSIATGPMMRFCANFFRQLSRSQAPEHEPVDLEEILHSLDSLRPAGGNRRPLPDLRVSARTTTASADVDFFAAARLHRLAGRVEDFAAEDEGVRPRDDVVRNAPRVRRSPWVSASQRDHLGRPASSPWPEPTKALSRLRTRRSTLRRRSCDVRLRAQLHDKRTIADERLSGEQAPGEPGVGRVRYMWTMSTSRPASPTKSVAALQRALSPTIPISRMPASLSARSSSMRRALLATGTSSGLSGRRGQCPMASSSDERIRPRVTLIHEERTGSSQLTASLLRLP